MIMDSYNPLITESEREEFSPQNKDITNPMISCISLPLQTHADFEKSSCLIKIFT